jgi:murein DD-endopeptidase MepM/ murein hydrolase activator NlpD
MKWVRTLCLTALTGALIASPTSSCPLGTSLPNACTAIRNPVIPDACLGDFRHGTLVTKNEEGGLVLATSPAGPVLTHPGVDLVAQCGTPIHPFADGEVVDVIDKDTDPDFRFLGYMVMLKHRTIKGKQTFSLYLHMEEPPKVRTGEVVTTRTELGQVGKTGAAWGCHCHFEIRHFRTRFLEDPSWNFPFNIYGKGDQQSGALFQESWENPETVFANLASGGTTGMATREVSDIHGVAFLNFDYPSDCWKDYPNSGFDRIIHVANGEWKKGAGVEEIYFGIVSNEVVYGDLNGDGQDEAVVHTACGFTAGNAWYDEVFVFAVSGGAPKLLTKLTPSDWSQDAWGIMWRVTDVQVNNGQLVITYLVGGSHAQPAWIATARFQWNGGGFVRTGLDRKASEP